MSARIRTIKPEFWTDERVVELSPFARLLFIGLWNFCDDEGRMTYSAKRLKLQILPADNVDCESLVGELVAQNLVQTYQIDAQAFLQVVGFTKHQKIDKRLQSKLPPNPAESRRITPTPANSPRITPTSADSPLRNGKERKGKEEDQGTEEKQKPPIPPKGGKATAISLPTYLDVCRSAGKKPIPEDDPVFAYAAKVGIPQDFLRLQWLEFKDRYCQPDAKRYKAWPTVFGKSVRGNWFRLWFLSSDGRCELTTTGLQAQRLHAEAA